MNTLRAWLKPGAWQPQGTWEKRRTVTNKWREHFNVSCGKTPASTTGLHHGTTAVTAGNPEAEATTAGSGPTLTAQSRQTEECYQHTHVQTQPSQRRQEGGLRLRLVLALTYLLANRH